MVRGARSAGGNDCVTRSPSLSRRPKACRTPTSTRSSRDCRRTSSGAPPRCGAIRGGAALCRTLLRAAVARVAGVPPENVGVEIEPSGRPVLTGALSRLFVSIAHSGSYVVVGVANRPVGVDVELLRHSPRFQQVAARVCSPAQLHVLAHSHGSYRDRAFLTMWARKEAYGKAQGLGRVRDLDVDPAYVAAVAAPGRIWRVRLDRIDRATL
jgi:phosphopantetheinyl transferase